MRGSSWGRKATLVEKARIASDTAVDGPIGFVAGLAMGPLGEVYVVDSQTPALRVYTPDGQFLIRYGQPGTARGEYAFPNGVAVLEDGRVILRDPRTSKLVVYAQNGGVLDEWSQPAGVYSALPLWQDEDGRLYNRVIYNQEAPRHDWLYGLVRISAEGEVIDTVPDPQFFAPDSDLEFRQLVVEVEDVAGGLNYLPLPFSPRTHWTFSPIGDEVRGISDRYAIDVKRTDGSVVRIEREWEPVRLVEGEKAEHYRIVDDAARKLDSRWVWRGPAIPEVKPPYSDLMIDQQGRIWVQLHRTARPAEGAEPPEEGAELPADPANWVEPVVFDVFEPDGTYLGQVDTPTGFSTYPEPVARGDTVWAVVMNADSAPSVVRFEIER